MNVEFIFQKRSAVDVRDLRSRYREETPSDAAFVRLTHDSPSPLVVWRCLVPGYIPIWFGWDLEPRGLDSVRLISRDIKSVGPWFPHPFA